VPAVRMVVDPELATRVLRAGSSPLSNREQKILGACAEGLSTAELAARCGSLRAPSAIEFPRSWESSVCAHVPRPSRSRETTAGRVCSLRDYLRAMIAAIVCRSKPSCRLTLTSSYPRVSRVLTMASTSSSVRP
jgi:hypothetical protein